MGGSKSILMVLLRGMLKLAVGAWFLGITMEAS
jgi:hypothetical protein